MAFVRRSGQRFTANVWPGFVDAMTALLLVLMFVLSIFMIVQFVLSETISDQGLELDALGQEVASLADALGLETARASALESEVATLGSERDAQAVLIATLNAQRDELTSRVASFEEQVASLIATRDRLSASLETTEGERSALAAQLETTAGELTRVIDEREALQLALATARDEVDAQAEAARLAAAQRDAVEALMADLRAEARTREATLAQTLAALEGQQAQAATLEDQVADLQNNLDAAEAARLAELAAAEALRTRLAEAETTLSEEESRRLADAAAAEALRERLANSDAELTAMTLALEEQRREAEETLTLLAATEASRDDLNARLAAALTNLNAEGSPEQQLSEALAALEDRARTETELRDQLAAALAAKVAAENIGSTALTEAQQRSILLDQARVELAQVEESRLVAQREAAVLNQQVAELRSQLSGLQNLLDAAADRDSEARVQLDSLGNRLNAALAQVASEQRARADLEEAERRRLERFQSAFFGELRDVLGDREGVEIVGDRFVFSSEVLFAAGDVTLQPEGRRQIAQVARLILEVADEIPSDLDWILRVDGHTDDLPLSGQGRYRSNWELSQARALSVVLYMIEELGVPPRRLAATGFGEFRPVDPASTPEARQRNRRIELKLTER
ncbi:peptidoglycan -binding protein [Jannaschia pohangensis]|uniref:Chemotaxis protein MotB n=1 Tax=Jannaschia pohangensis TaxID=390807 RepID=A0A1I3QLB3_9RHOB|nr:peptidoglycan -binding protein [Jannaschia pohangensis]SFJ34903.1 chemotaxis protein MotB [Jannaschia pohangensis]